jgi:CheY-like chemotaxis protein
MTLIGSGPNHLCATSNVSRDREVGQPEVTNQFDGPASGPAQRRILVVDDDELLREVAKIALELVGGWHVTTAHSGSEALNQALLARPDAVLLDVMMPGLDGPGTVATLRADPRTRDLPVIFLTAKMPSENWARWDRLGLAGVIPKPFDPMTLAAEMSRMLGWQE